MNKKIFIISALVFVLALSAFFLSRFFFSSRETVKEEKSDILEEINPFQAEKKEKIVKIVDGPVMGIMINPFTRQLLYFQNNKILLVDFEGETRNSIGAYPFGTVSQFDWSRDGKKALVKGSSGYFVYDLDRDNVLALPQEVDVAVWNQEGTGLLWKSFAGGKRKLVEANEKGEVIRELTEKIDYPKVDLISRSISGENCFYPMPESGTKGDLKCVDSQGELRTVDNDGYGTDYLWAPDGQKIMVSFVTEKVGGKISSGLISARGGNFINLNFPTLAQKCRWSSDSRFLFCAMLAGETAGINLPEDWREGKTDFADTFWKIDVASNKKERLMELDEINGVFDSEKLLLDNDEEYLFFINRKDGGIYRISL